MAELQYGLPPGWDCRVDQKSGKSYYVNHYTKTTTWDDPRHRHNVTNMKNMNAEHIPLQDLMVKMSPLAMRNVKIQDSSMSVPAAVDETVAKISAMFPTVSETHIRILMKNCRYMKSIFPNADETVILEILQNNENHIQKTSEALQEMGYSKKDTVKISQQKLEAKKLKEQEEIEKATVSTANELPRMKSAEEKEQLKIQLQNKYKDIAEHVIVIALESVNFDDDRANQILQIMIKEDNKVEQVKITEEAKYDFMDAPSTSKVCFVPISESRQSLKCLLKSEKEIGNIPQTNRTVDKNGETYISQNVANTAGHNPDLVKGPNENLLLEDYVKWQGSNTTLRKGSQGLASGPNKNLLSTRKFQVCGPNKDLRRGPQTGLSKGSMFAQMKTVLVGESRVK